jgi:enamine deaminase RidA (YjgF/YER057c/UK114 family)
MDRTLIASPDAPAPVGPYSQGLVTNGWRWTSGRWRWTRARAPWPGTARVVA